MTAAMLAMIFLPLLMALLLALPRLRNTITGALWLAPLPALLLAPAAWEHGATAITLPGGWRFVLDQPGALLLLASAILWCIGGVAASRWLARRDGAPRFALWWLLTLSGSLGIFIAGDVAGFYMLYALASLPAYGLIIFEGGAAEERAGRYTLAAALLGEGVILAAFVLLVAGGFGQGLSIDAVMQGVASSPWRDLVIGLVILGFGFKIGLVPLHGWMPMSYAAGPLAATAVLSGATSKAGLIGLIRFLPLHDASPFWGTVLLAAGLISAFYGAVAGLTQANPRSVLAYSSISQLGQMAAVLGAGLAVGEANAALLVAFYAVYHVLTKGGLFLALGETRRWTFPVVAVLALGFAGLPLTGGALGKLAVKQVLGDGVTSLLFSLAAIGSTVLMLHFLKLLRGAGEGRAQGGLAVTAVAGLLPWLLFSNVTGLATAYPFQADVIVKLSWPVALGALLAWVAHAAGVKLPRLPPGDVMVPGLEQANRLLRRAASALAGLEAGGRNWPAACLGLAVTLVIFVLLLR